jgi:anti-anti-sigma factor
VFAQTAIHPIRPSIPTGKALLSDSTLTPRGTPADEPPQPIAVHLLSPGETSNFDAVVKLCGEHDLATAADVRRALEPIDGSVLVDLADCQFIDSSVIGVLLRDSQARRRAGHGLELLVPEDNATITRTLTVIGVPDMIPVHSRPAKAGTHEQHVEPPSAVVGD